MKFKEFLRALRKKENMKIRELARKSGVSASYISMIENGLLTNDPSEATIKKLEDALGIKSGVLLAESTSANTVVFKKIYSNPEDAKKMRDVLDRVSKDPRSLDIILKKLGK